MAVGLLRFEDRLDAHQASFTKTERLVAAWLEGNPEAIAFQTVRSIANGSGVSEASIVRFARKLGYSSFTEMQQVAQREMQESHSLGDKLARSLAAGMKEGPLEKAFRTDLENLQKTYERLDERAYADAVRLISHARRVLVVGLRASAGAATHLAFALHLVRPDVSFLHLGLDNVHEQLLDVVPGDVLVAVSVGKPARRTVQVTVEAKERRGMAVVAITSSRLSALAQVADAALIVAVDGLFNSYAAVSSLSGALVDGVAAALHASARERLARLDAINAEGEVFAG